MGEAPDGRAAMLLDQLYKELRGMASRRLSRERADHTLQPTALVHEAYLRLERDGADFASREQFLGLAAQAMRRVLIDHARRHGAEKRGGNALELTLTGVDAAGELRIEMTADPLDLERVLQQLAQLDERQARIVELRYFAGATIPECADVVGLSTATVEREWRMARAWLRKELADG